MTDLELHNRTIEQANAEIAALLAAGHDVGARIGAQGVTIEIIRKGYKPTISYRVIPWLTA